MKEPPIPFSPVDGPYTLEYIGCTNWSQCIIFLKDMKLQGKEARTDLREVKGTFFLIGAGKMTQSLNALAMQA